MIFFCIPGSEILAFCFFTKYLKFYELLNILNLTENTQQFIRIFPGKIQPKFYYRACDYSNIN